MAADPDSDISGFQAQLELLGNYMKEGFDELKTMLRAFDERVRGVENREVGCQRTITARLEEAWRKLEVHDKSLIDLTTLVNSQMITMTKMIESQKNLFSILKWALGIITAVIILFVGALLTGQAYLVFK